MHKVFISGSMRIKNIDKDVLNRIDNIVSSGYQILVGDADGVDSSVQSYLLESGATSVSVYCTGAQPRNNIGKWKTNNIETKYSLGTRAYFTAKDLVMAEDCDYGLMIWDTKSTGTLSNALELLKRGKNSLVFVNKEKMFVKIKTASDIENLLTHMSDSAFKKADKKIGLLSTIESLKNEQSSLF